MPVFMGHFIYAGPTIPEPPEAKKYSALWERNPFAIASAEDAPRPGFAQNLAVVAVAKIGEETLVTLLDRQTQERHIVDSNNGSQGMRVVSVIMDSDPLKISVILRKGNETATVGFDRTQIAAASSPAPPAHAAAPPVPIAPALPAGGATASGAYKVQRRAPLVPLPAGRANSRPGA